jgi:hypothetical protein
MTRNLRCLVGLIVLLGVAPLVAVLWPAAATDETRGCMSVLGFGAGNVVPDLTNLFVGAGVGLVGIGFLVSCFFGREGEDEPEVPLG